MKKRIAVIEDDRIMADLIKRGLERSGFEIFSAFDGEEGLRIVESQIPDLVLLDLMLPKLDGLSVAKRLSENMQTKAIPVIILTVMEKTDAMAGILEDTGYDYIVKSNIDISEIINKVKEKLYVGSQRP